MSTSQNGYPVALTSANMDHGPLAAGIMAPNGLYPGDVAIVLRYVAAQFHERVERLHLGWCWGYNYRPIRGTTSGFSNHASGTAIDLNAPVHGRQAASRYLGFGPVQVDTIHRILAEAGHVVRWGGDYINAPFDPMHFEINANAAAVHAVALHLAAPVPVPPFSGPWIREADKSMVDVPVVQLGSDDKSIPGSPVWNVQLLLHLHGVKGADGKELIVDGQAGANTVAALKTLQTMYKLPVTGKTDGPTLATLMKL